MSDENTESKIQQLQMIEQSLQSNLVQKQGFQAQLMEMESAISEIKKSGKTAYKIIGNVIQSTLPRKGWRNHVPSSIKRSRMVPIRHLCGCVPSLSHRRSMQRSICRVAHGTSLDYGCWTMGRCLVGE